jgi:hypothetical protein
MWLRVLSRRPGLRRLARSEAVADFLLPEEGARTSSELGIDERELRADRPELR